MNPQQYVQENKSYTTGDAWNYPNTSTSSMYNTMGRPYLFDRYRPGTLSALMESSEGTRLWNNCNSDKTGGCSYGTYQIETKNGTMKDYLSYMQKDSSYRDL